MNKVELLAPAGDLERAYYALEYGADAVYIGGKQFSLRARASNFEIEDIINIVNHAHKNNKKVYLVTNIICHNFMLKEFKIFFDKVTQLPIDAYIVADPFIIFNLRKYYPHVEIHISTQQSITNSKSAAFWKRMGATRVVLAREMTFSEIKRLCDNNKVVEIEMFIHGAVCISYSGRCMSSNNYSLRDANVGGCAQSCRWEYNITNSQQDHYFTMSAKDMAYIDVLKDLMTLNIASFKIEGRMKTVSYLTTVIKNYRLAMDHLLNNTPYDTNKVKNELDQVANRIIDNAFIYGENEHKMLYHDEQKIVKQDYAFTINKKIAPCTFEITSKNYFDLNMKFKIIQPLKSNQDVKVISLLDSENNAITIVNTPMSKCIIKFDQDYDFNNYCIGRIVYE